MEQFRDPQSLQQWLSNVSANQQTKQYMQEFGRLYEILYSEISNILKQCLNLNNHTTVVQAISAQRKRIKLILNSLSKDNDPYLKCLQRVRFIEQYRLELEAFEKMLAVTQRLEKSKAGTHEKIQKRAFSAVQLKRSEASKSEYSLKKEVKKSEKRCLRAKSGTDLNRIIGKEIKPQKEKSNQGDTMKQMMENFKTKRRELEVLLREVISRPNRWQVTFEKKYDNLAGYFQKRIEFTDLYLGEDYVRQLRQKMQPLFEDTSNNNAQPSPFLTQFNIKTKSLKPHIKQKIDVAIREVKMQLIEQFHANRANKFMQINTQQHIQLVRPKRMKSNSSPSPRCETSVSIRRQANKWTRDTGRSSGGSTRISTAQPYSRIRYYKCNAPSLLSEEIDTGLLERIKRSTYN